MSETGPFGPWEPVERIGLGAFGVTWRCRHRDEPGREAAVKVLHAEHLRDRAYLERFAAERELVQSLGRTPHPHLAAYEGSDADRTGEPPTWIALGYVPGQALATCLHDGVLPDGEPVGASPADRYRLALLVGRAVASAAAHAHARGIVHRDIKPANLRVTPDRRVVLIDFGIGRDARVDRLTREDQQSPHTVTYAAPEVLRGDGVDDAWLGRLDVYSLGVLLFKLLTGQAAEVPIVIDEQGRTRTCARTAPLRLPPGYPEPLADLVRAMTEIAPVDRPDMASVTARLDALPDHLAGGLDLSPAPGAWSASPRAPTAEVDTWADRTVLTQPTRTLGPEERATRPETATPTVPRVDHLPDLPARVPGPKVEPPPPRWSPPTPPPPSPDPRLRWAAGLGGALALVVGVALALREPVATSTRAPSGGAIEEARLAATCGNGRLDLGEACDDGDVIAGDGCDPRCQREQPQPSGDAGAPPRCGDGRVDAGEGCDDGGTEAGDGCSPTCAPEGFPPASGEALRGFAAEADRAGWARLVAYVEGAPGWLDGFDAETVRAVVEAGLTRFDPPIHPERGASSAVAELLPTLGEDLTCAEVVGWLGWARGAPVALPEVARFHTTWCARCLERHPPLAISAAACRQRPDWRYVDGQCVHVATLPFQDRCASPSVDGP